MAGEDFVPDPNGLCFSPDFKKLYIVSTGQGPGDSITGGKGDMYEFNVGADVNMSDCNGTRPVSLADDSAAATRPRRMPAAGPVKSTPRRPQEVVII